MAKGWNWNRITQIFCCACNLWIFIEYSLNILEFICCSSNYWKYLDHYYCHQSQFYHLSNAIYLFLKLGLVRIFTYAANLRQQRKAWTPWLIMWRPSMLLWRWQRSCQPDIQRYTLQNQSKIVPQDTILSFILRCSIFGLNCLDASLVFHAIYSISYHTYTSFYCCSPLESPQWEIPCKHCLTIAASQ